ncbi:MAG: preprotein translocase subunit SecA [Thermodesulfobacteriota bacterium]
MINGVLKKVFGSKNERELKKLEPIVDKINAFEDEIAALTDEGLTKLTGKFRKWLSEGETLDGILPEAFAAVREASKRTLGMRHFDAQMIGGYVLHSGKIAEMKTGEGKTLAATLALYLNALPEKGAHLVTVNDYLAKRDARWMGPIYSALGLSVGVIQHEASFIYDPEVVTEDEFYQLRPVTRVEAYMADITYGTNNEYGFDYLRDNMKFSLDEYVQREHNYAIVDEVDSILIDEARTPLIISGPTEDSTDKYYEIDRVIPGLKKEDHFTVDEKGNQIFFTDDGVSKVEDLLKISNLYDPAHIETLHHVNQALKAHVLFERDVDYVVNDGQVIIVDEFTGRMMEGRRWSDGLHQAVEAKEGVKIENENQTLATITFQNYFRMYNKLSGMTGTADTEAGEFLDIYKLEVVVIPTNKPMVRDDKVDFVYKTTKEKFKAVVKDIEENLESGRPTLVGTISIDNSEKLSKMLKSAGIKHEVLNAKQHEREAEIVAQAGAIGSVTLSTNMAGRGTDIVLGGNPVFIAEKAAGKDERTDEYKAALKEAQKTCGVEKEKVLALGGLYILGTERHESRRIDNQLRGRSGRQGDAGTSRFYVTLEDDLMRIFGSDRISGIMDKLGMEEDTPIEHSLVSKAIEGAQKKVEGHNFDIRKHLLEYDDVMNQQREVVYGYRRQILGEGETENLLFEFSEEVIEDIIDTHIDEKAHIEEWDTKSVMENAYQILGAELTEDDLKSASKREELIPLIAGKAKEVYSEKVESAGRESFEQFERYMMLSTLDNLWKDHLLSMDHLKSGIGLRGYGQKDPLNEYKKEGFDLFAAMIFTMKCEVVERIQRVQIQMNEEGEEASEPPVMPEMPKPREQKVTLSRGEEQSGGEPEKQKPETRAAEKIGRNAPCPCGSNKKYKKCCGK